MADGSAKLEAFRTEGGLFALQIPHEIPPGDFKSATKQNSGFGDWNFQLVRVHFTPQNRKPPFRWPRLASPGFFNWGFLGAGFFMRTK